MTRDNHMVGRLQVEGIGATPWGVSAMEVSVDLDANGIRNVHAEDKSPRHTHIMTITNDKGRLSKSDIERMVQEAERYKEEDSRQRDKMEAKNGLEK